MEHFFSSQESEQLTQASVLEAINNLEPHDPQALEMLTQFQDACQQEADLRYESAIEKPHGFSERLHIEASLKYCLALLQSTHDEHYEDGRELLEELYYRASQDEAFSDLLEEISTYSYKY